MDLDTQSSNVLSGVRAQSYYQDQLNSNYSTPAGNPYPNHPGKIFVGNLPNDISKDVLYKVFSTYGNVLDVHIMTGKSDSGQACSFVEYSSQLEAQTAITTLNNNYEIREGESHPSQTQT